MVYNFKPPAAMELTGFAGDPFMPQGGTPRDENALDSPFLKGKL